MPELFELLADEYETIVYGHDPTCDMKAIIAVHSTALGPALGGLRFYPYQSEDAALQDVLRLARGMSYKAAAAGLDLGGGKAVVIGDPDQLKSTELLHSFGRLVNRLAGSYITAADVGVDTADIDTIAEVSAFVGGTSQTSGDPSPVTALGVFHAIKAVARELWQSDGLSGMHVAVQGTGKVGSALVRQLSDSGAQLTIADIDSATVNLLAEETGASICATDDIHSVACDILSPCALGATLNDSSIPKIKARAVAGAANNQLALPRHSDLLAQRNILYAPDYVANAGGLINIASERHGYQAERALAAAAAIEQRMLDVFAAAKARSVSPAQVAEQLARERIAAVYSSRR